MADYSAYPLAEPDVQDYRIRFLCIYVSLSVANLHIVVDNSRSGKCEIVK
jgi:hypothetical protein